MRRKPCVFYLNSRNAYYCRFNGRQHKLVDGPDDFPNGPQYTSVLEAFGRLMQPGSVPRAAPLERGAQLFRAMGDA